MFSDDYGIAIITDTCCNTYVETRFRSNIQKILATFTVNIHIFV